jgi:hypothetical protein
MNLKEKCMPEQALITTQIDSIRQFLKTEAEKFGAKTGNDNKSFIERHNIQSEALKDNGAYFGFIRPEEDPSGPYHDFSLVIFPSNPSDLNTDETTRPWLVCLGIGSSGFKNDYNLATYPGVRRLFSKLVNENGFCKSDFSDIETSLPKTITGNQNLQHIKNTIKTYTKVLPVCQIIENPESNDGKKIISAFIAGYAKLRDWPSNKGQRDAVSEALDPFLKMRPSDDTENIEKLLEERRFIVLQGPPGTGKTRIAKKVAKEIKAATFFTQFHAETSYSDFIYGIRPKLNGASLNYEKSDGIFTTALSEAIDNPTKKVILIIDEINRANLSNVLGPVFYLFEHKMESSNVEIEVSPGVKITNLPKNFYVIATMNTADRSLAVVDFALRRRFAWYSLMPKIIDKDLKEERFFDDDFIKIQEIFNWYASSNELSLQPGQGYFIAKDEKEMENRIRYEIFPLVKEYLQEGLLKNSKEEFNSYFSTRIKQSLFE